MVIACFILLVESHYDLHPDERGDEENGLHTSKELRKQLIEILDEKEKQSPEIGCCASQKPGVDVVVIADVIICVVTDNSQPCLIANQKNNF